MQYVGGKQKSGGHRIAAQVKRIAAAVGVDVVHENMCGGLSVTQRLGGLAVEARDLCRPLIALYLAMRDGWVPPANVTQDEWERWRALSADPGRHADPMLAFVGFGCSRSGAWFSSYVADYKYTKRRVPAATAARDSLRKKLDACKGVRFIASDYSDVPARDVWYCDIPYAGTLGYPAVGKFDHGRFWAHVSEVSRRIPVLVSERQAPEGWLVLDEWTIQQRITTNSEGHRKIERLYVHERWSNLIQR